MIHWMQPVVAALTLVAAGHGVSSFRLAPTGTRALPAPSCRPLHRTTLNLPSSGLRSNGSNDDSWEAEEDFEILFEDEPNLDIMEKAWRYAKKPLLSIGAKGASFSHGNSLRQLLDSHTAVKVKVNINKFGTLEKAFEDIKSLAEEAGAPEGIEMLQARDKDKVILFALPGTTERLESGDFPPPPPPPKESKDSEE